MKTNLEDWQIRLLQGMKESTGFERDMIWKTILGDKYLESEEEPDENNLNDKDIISKEVKDKYGIIGNSTQYGIRKDGSYGVVQRIVYYNGGKNEKVQEDEKFSFEK